MFKNYQLEDVLKQLLDAKKAEQEKYYGQVADGVNQEGGLANKSPIETVRLSF